MAALEVFDSIIGATNRIPMRSPSSLFRVMHPLLEYLQQCFTTATTTTTTATKTTPMTTKTRKEFHNQID